MQKHVNFVDLVKSFRTNIYLQKIGVDTAENEPLKVHLIFKLWDLIFTEPPCLGSGDPREGCPVGPAEEGRRGRRDRRAAAGVGGDALRHREAVRRRQGQRRVQGRRHGLAQSAEDSAVEYLCSRVPVVVDEVIA